MNLTKTQKDEFQHRFDALEKLIQQRVGDETRHPEKLEYQTYPTTVFFKSF